MEEVYKNINTKYCRQYGGRSQNIKKKSKRSKIIILLHGSNQ